MAHDWSKRFFVAYKGDDIICSGTVFEISEKLQMKLETCKWLTSNVAKNREKEFLRKNGTTKRMVLVEG